MGIAVADRFAFRHSKSEYSISANISTRLLVGITLANAEDDALSKPLSSLNLRVNFF